MACQCSAGDRRSAWSCVIDLRRRVAALEKRFGSVEAVPAKKVTSVPFEAVPTAGRCSVEAPCRWRPHKPTSQAGPRRIGEILFASRWGACALRKIRTALAKAAIADATDNPICEQVAMDTAATLGARRWLQHLRDRTIQGPGRPSAMGHDRKWQPPFLTSQSSQASGDADE